MAAVLLVEDEPEVAELIAEALDDAGLQVTTTLTDTAAYAALEAGGARGFDVLVADINLGVGTTGFDVARRARQLNDRLKVIYITGQAARLERFGVEEGMMFPKPFNARELADSVRELIETGHESGAGEAPPTRPK
ncbi:MAG TPA: response regulator [Phenylobacterium sp.]|jgi:DNA-binding response OmpR family regulator|nr:response regulator [Phenylobacterium sp.]